MTMQHIRDYSVLCTDETTIRHTREAIAAYRLSGNRKDLEAHRNPWFRDAVRSFRVPTGNYTDADLEV